MRVYPFSILSIVLMAGFIFAGLCLPPRLHAEEPTSIEAALHQLVRNHPRTRAEAERLASALSRARYRNLYYPDPMIGYMWMNAPYKKDPADLSPRAFTQTELMISQAVPTPGRLSVESDIADLDARRARLRLLAVGNELVTSYLRDLTRAWKTLHHRDLTRIYAGRFRPILSISGAQYALGKGGLVDLAMARLTSRNLEEKQSRYANQYESAKAALQYYGMQREPQTHDGEIPPLDAYALRVLASTQSSTTAAERSPDVALMGIESEIASKRKTLTKFEYAPDFTFFAKYYRSEPGNHQEFGTRLPDNQLNLGLTVRVPLWSALNNHNNVNDAGHGEEAAGLDRANLAQSANAAETALHSDITGFDERIALYRTRLIPEAERAVLSAREAYQAGRGDFNSLLRVWESLYSLEMEAVDLQGDRLERIFELGRLVNVIQPPVASELTNQPPVHRTGEVMQ